MNKRKRIALIPINESVLGASEMLRTKGGDPDSFLNPVEGGACCICMPNLSATGIGATEKARH